MCRVSVITFIVSIFAVSFSGCAVGHKKNTKVKICSIEVLDTLPHDVSSYTQGLFFYKDTLYESAGQYGESSFRQTDLKTGKVLKRLNFGKDYFLEGSCVLNGKLYILTWQENTCFVYDMKTLGYIKSFHYKTEGWGLTTDGKNLIMSDGSSTIYFRDPDNFKIKKKIDVTYKGRSIKLLNELEYINGKIWSNVYTKDDIVLIDPESGQIEKLADCRNLLPSKYRKPETDVFNGIAYEPSTGSIYVTGKYWPLMFKIKLSEK
ncbi:MAG: glutaminyl-peptide cyclotransferase [Bacteroidales bacterium]|jgi:glutamine cyclotransferase|nr:glutaminyl-peptide cyclotransferase [Bacteroidales bacterium]